jgi:hypothetical protein
MPEACHNTITLIMRCFAFDISDSASKIFTKYVKIFDSGLELILIWPRFDPGKLIEANSQANVEREHPHRR